MLTYISPLVLLLLITDVYKRQAHGLSWCIDEIDARTFIRFGGTCPSSVDGRAAAHKVDIHLTDRILSLIHILSNVKMGDIQDAPVLSIDQALQGRIAGADIMSTTGEPGATTSIRIRGTDVYKRQRKVFCKPP